MSTKSNSIEYVCKVDGIVGIVGKYYAMCRKVGVSVNGEKSKCMAHGNKKCVHKIKQEIPK